MRLPMLDGVVVDELVSGLKRSLYPLGREPAYGDRCDNTCEMPTNKTTLKTYWNAISLLFAFVSL